MQNECFEKSRSLLEEKSKKSILLLVILTLVLCVFMLCLCLEKGSQESIKNLRKIYGCTFTLKFNYNVGGEIPVINDEMVDKILSVGGIRDVCKESNGMPLYFKDLEFIPGLFKKSLSFTDDVEEQKSVFMSSKTMMPYGYNKTNLNHYFQTNTLELIEGRHIEETDYNKVLISDEIAELNHLKLGDLIHGELNQNLLNGGDVQKVYDERDLEIVGIFHANMSQITNQYTAEWDIIQNLIFVNCRTEQDLWRIKHEIDNRGKEVSYSSVMFYLEDSREIEAILNCAKKIDDIDWNMLELTVDDTLYRSALVPLQTIRKISIFMIFFVIIVCIILLVLILKMWIRTRKKEMGILLSLGNRQSGILIQFVLEGLVILSIAFVISCGITAEVSKQIGNRMLFQMNKNEERLKVQQREKQKEMVEEIPDSFDEYMAIVEQFEVEAEVETPEELECRLTIQIAVLSGILMLIVLVVVTIFAVRETLKMKPKDILTSL